MPLSTLRVVAIAAFLLAPKSSQGQEPPPTPAQFKASVVILQTKSAQWRKVIDSVKIVDLPVQYATGKQFEQSQYIVGEDLKMALLWAGRAGQSGSLFDEINYMSAVQELQTQLQLFSSLISDFTVADKAKTVEVQNWSQAMSDIANGPVDTAFKAAYAYTTRHALQVEKSCSSR
jgi:hypothetical protein